MAKINVKGTEVTIVTVEEWDYISLTDMVKHKNASATGYVISRWLSARYTIDFMGIWEKVNNPDFNVVESTTLKMKVDSMVTYLLPNTTAFTQMP